MLHRIIFSGLFLLIGTVSIQAQSCQADSTYLDSTGFVFPLPYDSLLNPNGGIDKEACINVEFDFTWTLKVPDTIEFPGIPIPLPVISFDIPTSGAINNLPIGLTYVCNPPNCIFLAGEMGCVRISGIPTSANPVGTYDLEFVGTLKTTLGANIPVTFPNQQLYPGHYFLELNEENSPNCLSSTEHPDGWANSVKLIPNPVTDIPLLHIESSLPQSLEIQVVDATGRTFRSWKTDIDSGVQDIPLDLHDLPAGYWIYQVRSARGQDISGGFIRTSR